MLFVPFSATVGSVCPAPLQIGMLGEARIAPVGPAIRDGVVHLALL